MTYRIQTWRGDWMAWCSNILYVLILDNVYFYVKNNARAKVSIIHKMDDTIIVILIIMGLAHHIYMYTVKSLLSKINLNWCMNSLLDQSISTIKNKLVWLLMCRQLHGKVWIWLKFSDGLVILTAKKCNWNFQPLEVVSRWRDSQPWVTKWRSTILRSCWSMLRFIFNVFKNWHLMW